MLCIRRLTKYFCVMACVYRHSCKLGKNRRGAGGNRAAFTQLLVGKLSGYQLNKDPQTDHGRKQENVVFFFPFTRRIKCSEKAEELRTSSRPYKDVNAEVVALPRLTD